jgi:hypothetical protein
VVRTGSLKSLSDKLWIYPLTIKTSTQECAEVVGD